MTEEIYDFSDCENYDDYSGKNEEQAIKLIRKELLQRDDLSAADVENIINTNSHRNIIATYGISSVKVCANCGEYIFGDCYYAINGDEYFCSYSCLTEQYDEEEVEDGLEEGYIMNTTLRE